MNQGTLALLIHGGTENWSPARWKRRFDEVCGDRRVWLVTEPQGDGTVVFRAESDGHISRGNVALLLKLYSGHTPAEILAFDAKAGLDRLGLPAALTPQRSNGVRAMADRIHRDATRLAAA